MIEINLLPQELRRSEGTPLPRLLSIIVGVVLAVVGGLFISNYYFVEIPATVQKIKEEDRKLLTATTAAALVDAVDAKIVKIKGKVEALRNLQNGRVRWARVLDRFSRSIPDGCVFKNLAVVAEGGGLGTAQKFRLNFTGYTSGETEQDCYRKLREVLTKLDRQFEVVEGTGGEDLEDAAVDLPEGELPKGYSKFLRLRFDEPRIANWQMITMPTIILPKGEKKVRAPKRGLSFNMSMSFNLPPVQGN